MIRRANFSDLELLHYLGRKTFEDTFGGTCTKADMKEVLDRFFNKEQCALELLDEQDYFFFLEEEGVVKGYIRLHDKHACPIPDGATFRCMELVRCYFLKEHHGTGAANELLRYAVSFAREMGYEKLYLSVWEYNFRARGFYEKHGFVNSGIENDFPLGSTPQTDLWFVKDL